MHNTKIRAKLVDGATRLRVLIKHPMHTGRQRDPATGALIPAHYIQRLRVECNDQLMVDCQLSTAVSRDPYLEFRFAGGAVGDRVSVSWEDNLGRSDRQEALVRSRSGE